ncbi:hypothetical protein CSUI_006854 [Cystoisospora suis]|uniref:Secreted protein n=1 Tax=Cystoisospora suis TaxID=483139 RepID=A0A2C6KSM6_9APIC|nr:hypothetical protein CSUI_006854 [Cystoisospora suis]
MNDVALLLLSLSVPSVYIVARCQALEKDFLLYSFSMSKVRYKFTATSRYFHKHVCTYTREALTGGILYTERYIFFPGR